VIRGYAEQPSPRAGGELTLRVSTDAPRFRVEFYRCGARLVRQADSPWLPGRDAPPHLPFQDWGAPGVGLHGEPLAPWPAFRFPVPAGWRSGVHVAVLVEGDGDGRDRSHPDRTTADAREAKALFVVRPGPAHPPASILYKIPLLTYHAYNVVDGGGWCLYNMDGLSGGLPRCVGLHRPGGGTGGTPYDIGNFDPFDPTPRQTFAHWDARFAGWLEEAGYPVDYCTDVDLHRDGPALLRPYRLLVSAGHDEYWSDAMRAAVEDHVAAGRNAAFFGGNTFWWRVVFDDPLTFSRRHVWSAPDGPGKPENTLIGVSFRNGGERDRDDHPVPVGYRVQHSAHWVFAGTGVRDGDVFGGGPDEYLVGYECDGAEFDRSAWGTGRPVTPTGRDGTPADFVILAVGDTRPSGWGLGNAAATMGLHTRHGTVFNAATTDWARVLTARTSPVVERITRNVLNRLGR
jgi:hypothetical protein